MGFKAYLKTKLLTTFCEKKSLKGVSILKLNITVSFLSENRLNRLLKVISFGV